MYEKPVVLVGRWVVCVYVCVVEDLGLENVGEMNFFDEMCSGS